MTTTTHPPLLYRRIILATALIVSLLCIFQDIYATETPLPTTNTLLEGVWLNWYDRHSIIQFNKHGRFLITSGKTRIKGRYSRNGDKATLHTTPPKNMLIDKDVLVNPQGDEWRRIR